MRGKVAGSPWTPRRARFLSWFRRRTLPVGKGSTARSFLGVAPATFERYIGAPPGSRRVEPRAPGRFVVVTSFSWPKPGGLERVVELELKELHARGHEVHLLCARSDRDPQEFLGTDQIRVHRAPYKYVSFLPGFVPALWFALTNAPRLRRLAQGGAPVHAHNTYAALCAILAGLRKRTALHLHSVSSEDHKLMEASALPFAARLLLRIDAAAHRFFEALTYNLVPAVLAVSEYELEDAKRKMRRPERAHLVRNGVDTTLFKPDPEVRARIRKELGLADGEALVLFLGRFVPKNGTLVIAQAVPEANKPDAPPARWVFAGTGTEEPQMREVFEKHAAKNVTFLPPQASHPLYAAADVFVSHVGTAVEGHGLTVIEAMACGAPTVTGDDRIKREVFTDGTDLVFVPKDDPKALARAVVDLLKDPARRERLGKDGREMVVRDLSVKAQVDAVLQHLQ